MEKFSKVSLLFNLLDTLTFEPTFENEKFSRMEKFFF